MFHTQPLSQRDPRWSNQWLGFGDASTTLGSDGCTLTCLTLVANGFGFADTPASLNEKLKSLGPNIGFSGPLIVFSGLPAADDGISLQNIIFCTNLPAPMADIDAALDAGLPVVVELDQSPSPGLQNHWVVIYARENGDYLIHDPWPVPAESGVSLVGRYGFAGSPVQIIDIAVFYAGSINPAPVQPPQPLTLVVIDTPEIAQAGGLALRDAPISGTVLKRLPAGTLLRVNELGDQALLKVGHSGEWFAVTVADGLNGFVAAWLVQAPAPKDLMRPLLVRHPLPPVANPSLSGIVQPPLRRTEG
jgi:hypothetical protein